jgi:hypothetical protein
MIIVFTLISIVMLPALFIYKSYGGYDTTQASGMAVFSLGNMGYANVQCSRSSYATFTNALYCPQGRIKSIVDYGIIPSDS